MLKSFIFVFIFCLPLFQSSPVFRPIKILYDDGVLSETLYTDEESNLIESDENFNGTVSLRSPFGSVLSKVKDIGEYALEKLGRGAKTLASIPEHKYHAAREHFKNKLKLIFPGTRWCGDGDKARYDDDLGYFRTTDICCRGHDKCPNFIAAGEQKFGLNNTGLFTRSHCDCDKEFFNCLKNATGLLPSQIGYTYFTLLGPQCFREDYLVRTCSSMRHGRCLEYEFSSRNKKSYQWFDNPLF